MNDTNYLFCGSIYNLWLSRGGHPRHHPEELGFGWYLSSHFQVENHLFLSNIASVTKRIRSVDIVIVKVIVGINKGELNDEGETKRPTNGSSNWGSAIWYSGICC